MILKWLNGNTLNKLKEKEKEPEAPKAEPGPTTEAHFLCSYEGCGKTFIDAGALRKLLHIHGERQHVCHWEGCGNVSCVDLPTFDATRKVLDLQQLLARNEADLIYSLLGSWDYEVLEFTLNVLHLWLLFCYLFADKYSASCWLLMRYTFSYTAEIFEQFKTENTLSYSQWRKFLFSHMKVVVSKRSLF